MFFANSADVSAHIFCAPYHFLTVAHMKPPKLNSQVRSKLAVSVNGLGFNRVFLSIPQIIRNLDSKNRWLRVRAFFCDMAASRALHIKQNSRNIKCHDFTKRCNQQNTVSNLHHLRLIPSVGCLPSCAEESRQKNQAGAATSQKLSGQVSLQNL